MKKIINGKTYNTATATLVCEHNFYNNGNWHASKDLYKTKSGIYFIATQGNKRDLFAPDNCITIINREEAKMFCEEYGNPEEYIAEWGE